MILRISSIGKRLRRMASRDELAARLLVPHPERKHHERRGLILLQIDGLARHQLEAAMQSGRTPFLKSLLTREEYRLHSWYSGVPSTTPAVQGELFYGAHAAVPSFGFRDHENGRMTSMFSIGTATQVEQRLAAAGPGLLEGGSSYANVYAGGADRAAFCFTKTGIDRLLNGLSALKLMALGLLHAMALVRVAVLLIVESLLALADFIRGIAGRQHFFKELKFVPSRVGVCILLREMVTASVLADVALGVPVIHANFLGYDEQSHRRGPSSAFAHWTLKGIDWSLQRIWKAAHRSSRRDYDIWVYSDHGQESTTPYRQFAGRPLQAAVESVLDTTLNDNGSASENGPSIQSRRWALLGLGHAHGLPSGTLAQGMGDLTGLGPVNHLYLYDKVLTDRELERIARELVERARVPAVVGRCRSGAVVAWTSEGRYRLPDDVAAIVGHNHPFIKQIGTDIVRLATHPDAGSLILFGWRQGHAPLTFALENGSHCGLGPEETHGFALLPHDAPLPSHDEPYIRPLQMRQACLRLMSKAPLHHHTVPSHTKPDGALRIMTYNIHACVGFDGRCVPERYARVIAQHAPDIVALQEVDVGRGRSRGMHQAERIAERLGMSYHFHPCHRVDGGLYGIAVLSRLPVRVVQAGMLPTGPNEEPRGAIWVEAATANGTVQCIATHLSLSRLQRVVQVKALLGHEWLGQWGGDKPLVLLGDLNMRPRASAYRALADRLIDAALVHGASPPGPTWMGIARIDHVFVSPHLDVLRWDTVSSRLTRLASDHSPVLVDLRVREGHHRQTRRAQTRTAVTNGS